MQKRTISNNIILIFFVFFVIHVLLLNINFAEWGDSYRILRASEFIRQGSYPEDEKRQPLYSLTLALRPSAADQVLWGRLEMLAISVGIFWLFYKLLQQFDLSQKSKELALWIFALNPVLLYWSLRIMADVPFMALTLLTFYLYYKWKDDLTTKNLILLGLLVGMAVITRFEGYILGFSLGLALLLNNKDNSRLGKALTLILGIITVMIPWFIYRNPINSTYFEEPSTRVYDLRMVHIYLVSIMYMFGFTSACFFFYRNIREYIEFSKKYKAITIFIGIELFLALIWPAAIPRLLIPIIPLLIIPLAIYIDRYFNSGIAMTIKGKTVLLGLLGIFLISQYILKLQFLVPVRQILILVALVQLFSIVSILGRKYKLFIVTLVFSMLVWSFSTIWLHKDIFRAVVEANKYVQKNLSGRIVHNDVSSVTDWYLNGKTQNDQVEGIYLNMDSKVGRTRQALSDKKADYVMITNEHNTTLEFSADEVGHLEQIAEFRYTIRGKVFFTKILKFRNYEQY